MRGKDIREHFEKPVNRITPAYAGKRRKSQTLSGAQRDHPRVCGEKAEDIAVKVSATGSPPRMRGKVFLTLSRSSSSGITPAYAGKSLAFHLILGETKDHPRVCGEKMRARLCE